MSKRRFASRCASFAALLLSTSAVWAQTPQPKPDTPAQPKANTAPPPAAQTTPAGQAAPAEEAPTNLRLRTLEQKVEVLKEQAWRVKARVGMLKEAVLGGGVGARATIVHDNQMGGSFKMVRLVYALDGVQIFSRADDTGKLGDIKNLDILSGPIAPGNHTLGVIIDYRGNGYGVFSYLKEYKFNVKSSHTFTAAEGKQTQITVVGYEKGGITAQLKDRPSVEFKVSVTADKPGTVPAAAPASPPPGN
jgi:hypothetical protein